MKIKETNDTETRLILKDREIIIYGTAHISENSVEEVKEAIKKEEPDAVCVEIDNARYKTISEGRSWKEMNIAKLLKEKKGFLLISNLVLSSFQKRMGVDVGVTPGEEMIAAINCSKKNNIPFILADRDVQITLRRAWAKSGFIGKAKLLSSLIGSIFAKEQLTNEDIEKLKERSALSVMMNELAEYLPTIKEVLIDERDQYLASNIFDAKGEKILVVVGAGHVPGMIKQIQKLEEGSTKINREDLNLIPKPSIWKKASNFIIPTLLIGALIWATISGGSEAIKKITLSWFFWNSLLSALGATLAGGHPLSIIVAYFAAPITSAGIPISSGVVAGIVESFLRKPKVGDVTSLSNNIQSIKGVYQNRVTRSLLVFFLSSVGSIIGTWVALTNIASRLI